MMIDAHDALGCIAALGVRLRSPDASRPESLCQLLQLAYGVVETGSASQEVMHHLADAVAWAAAPAAQDSDRPNAEWNALACICAAAGQPHEEALAPEGFADGSAVGVTSSPFPLLWLPHWLPESEVSEVLAIAEAALWKPSPLATTGDASVRTSESLVLREGEVACKLRARAARLVGLAPEFAEPPQLVRYKPGQLYHPHVDWGHGAAVPWQNRPRSVRILASGAAPTSPISGTGSPKASASCR
ncbi:unnamed protein product [Effrenium voratum]|nr:unnamed protein product [Effrenium voratum]